LDENPLLLPFAEEKWAYSFITEMELSGKKKSKNNRCHFRVLLLLLLKADKSGK
jgi:hypothetical protein